MEKKVQAMSNNKQIIHDALGKELYANVYEFLKFHRKKGTDEAKMHQEIKFMVNNNKQLMNHCFNLDCIVFMELMQGN